METDREFRINKRNDQKKLLHDTIYKKFDLCMIDYLYYFFYENDYDDYLNDEEKTIDHFRNDYHILYAIVDKKVIRLTSQSSYDFMTDHHEVHSYESHAVCPHISTFLVKKFVNCNQKHTCYNCNSFNITSTYYCRRNRNNQKIYIRDDLCHNCEKEIQHMSHTPLRHRVLTFQDKFISLYNEECKRRFYMSYFLTTVLNELVSIAMNPARIEWIIDSDQKTLWNYR